MYVVYKGEVLVLSPELVNGIPLLHSLFTFSDPPIFEVPDVKKFQKRGLVRLRELVKFTQDPLNYPPPTEHLELFGMVRLADFLGMDGFMETAAMWLGVSVSAISNHNSVQSVLQLIRGRYRAPKDKSSKYHGDCAWCGRSVYVEHYLPHPPEEPGPPLSICCNRLVHPHCRPSLECRTCRLQF